MYPPPKTPLPSTLGFVPRLPNFSLLHQIPYQNHLTHTIQMNQQKKKTSPESSLPCGQQTPRGSTSPNSTPSEHTPPQSVVPPQPTTPQSHNSNNTHPHTQSQKTLQSSPLHNPSSSFLLGQILIQTPSLPFQQQRHINWCRAHHCSTFLSLQMVKE